jgi:hypothetical protein
MTYFFQMTFPMKKIITSVLLSFVFVATFGQSKPQWDINGSTWLASANLSLYYPLATASFGLEYAIMPGIELNLRKIRSPKKELEFGTYISTGKFPYKERNRGGSSFATGDPIRANYFGVSLGRRKYSLLLSRGFAPVGLYSRWSLKYEATNALIPAGHEYSNKGDRTDVGSQKYKSKSVGIGFGLGKEFPIRERLFMGFSTNFTLLVPIQQTDLGPSYEHLSDNVNGITMERSIIIVNYNVSYLLQ